MIKALWLPSWYPSIESIQNGDFIERHAWATSNYANVLLYFVQSSSKINGTTRNNLQKNIRFIESVTIFPAIKYFKFLNLIRYFIIFNKQIKDLNRAGNLPDLVHVHVSYKAGLIALWLKYKYNLPYVITEHWSYFNIKNAINYSGENFIKKYIIKLIFNNSSHVLPVSQDLKNNLQLFFPKITSSVIPNVVDPSLFNFQENTQSDHLFKFIHISSMVKLKNPRGIINAFIALKKKYKFVTLELIGGTSSSFIEEIKAEVLLTDSIIFRGQLEHNAVASALKNANAFILFSSYENLPCVIAESLCSGIPVISSSVGGVPEMVNDTNGILVPAEDEEALFQAMNSMILNYDRYDRRQVSADALAKYNTEVVGRQIVEVYEKVLSKK